MQIRAENQGRKLMQITSIANQPVTVQLHRTLNEVKGTVLSEALEMNTETEILWSLKKARRYNNRADEKTGIK